MLLFVVLCLANQTGVDLQKMRLIQKLALKTKRDHDRHHNNDKLIKMRFAFFNSII